MKLIIRLAFSRISFDFDGVLSTSKGQTLAKKFLDSGATVFIITARDNSQSSKVYEVADVLGIKRNQVVFTAHKDKWQFMNQYKIGTHYDNNLEQVKKINEKTQTKGVLFTNN
jgi:hypothetical protein